MTENHTYRRTAEMIRTAPEAGDRRAVVERMLPYGDGSAIYRGWVETYVGRAGETWSEAFAAGSERFGESAEDALDQIEVVLKELRSQDRQRERNISERVYVY